MFISAYSEFSSWDSERDELARILAARYRNQYVLLSVDHVGHRRVADAGRQLHLPYDLSSLLVESVEHFSAESRRHADAGVAALPHEHECFRHDCGVASRCADVRQIQALECRMIPDAGAVGDRPQNFALVQIDRRQL